MQIAWSWSYVKGDFVVTGVAARTTAELGAGKEFVGSNWAQLG